MTDVAATHAGPLALDAAAQRLLFTEARSANTFSGEPVTEEQLRAIHELVKFAPTSSNGQPLRVLYVDRGEARDRLVRHLNPGNQAKTRRAPMVAVLAADTRFHEHFPVVYPPRPDLRDHYEAHVQSRLQYASFNSTLQAGYFLLGVRAAGLAAGPMSGFDAEGIDTEFFHDRPWKSILVVNIGRPGPGAWEERLPRLSFEQTTLHI